MLFGADEGAVRRFREAARAIRVPLKIVQEGYEGDRLAYEARLILVRPDQYVVWAGDQAPADATAVLKGITALQSNA